VSRHAFTALELLEANLNAPALAAASVDWCVVTDQSRDLLEHDRDGVSRLDVVLEMTKPLVLLACRVKYRIAESLGCRLLADFAL
jgi:hypothetical protein